MELTLSFLLFALGIILVIKGGDWFVDAASWIARAANIPTFIIGATIVSLATTLPEMIVSVIAAIDGKNDMAVGNAVGSVTANTGLIMALALIFMTVKTPRKNYLRQCLLLLGAAAVLWAGSMNGTVAMWACIVLLMAFVTFMVINVRSAKQTDAPEEKQTVEKKDIGKNIVLFVIGAAGIVLGSNLLIDNGSAIATALGVPERVIAVTMVAIGTSLPELVTTLTAIKKKEANLSVGNIIGANIIDLSLILPICAFVSGESFTVSAQSLQLDFPVCLLISCMAMLPLVIKERGYKVQGILMLVAYVAYLVISI